MLSERLHQTRERADTVSRVLNALIKNVGSDKTGFSFRYGSISLEADCSNTLAEVNLVDCAVIYYRHD